MALCDWIIVALFLLGVLGGGLWFSRRASGSLENFFLSGRPLPWWLAGTSILATSFASDTPLHTTSVIRQEGLGGAWFYWSGILTHLVVTFCFARLWRRTGIVTDAEMIELRYAGRSAAILRATTACTRGLFLEGLTLAWVTLGMVKVVGVLLELPPTVHLLGFALPSDVALVAVLIVLVLIYSVSSGLWGVVVTDLIEFVVAMGGALLLSVIAWSEVGGLEGLQAGLAALQAELAAGREALEAAVAANAGALATIRGLEAEEEEVLSHLSLVQLPLDDQGAGARTIRISGANLQVVNGSGSTAAADGLGNLIIGYQETRESGNDRSGSHNLVVGRQNNYSSWGGQVVGSSNTVRGLLSSVCGGEGNTASGDYSVVGGGVSNLADGSGSLVGGGRGNAATGIDSVISGGRENRAEGFISTVGGGGHNTASTQFSVIGGGERNESSEAHTTIAGGRSNRAIGVQSTVSGGTQNSAAGVASVVGGGGVNTADGFVGVVSGGFGNVARGDDSSVRGGRDNSTSDGEHGP